MNNVYRVYHGKTEETLVNNEESTQWWGTPPHKGGGVARGCGVDWPLRWRLQHQPGCL